MSTPIRIIMADDHEIFRDGFALMFEKTNDFELVGQASNGKSLVAMVAAEKPDVVLTDIQMPEMTGVEATRIIRDRFPEIQVIAISMFLDDDTIIQMLKVGAIGYVGKNSPKQVIYEAIRAAYMGKKYLCNDTSKKVAAMIKSRLIDQYTFESLVFNPTELRIINYICEDLDTYDIAEKLSISRSAVKKMKMDIMEKSDTKSSAALIIYAIRNGIYKV